LNAIVSNPVDQRTISEGDPFGVWLELELEPAILTHTRLPSIIHDAVCSDIYRRIASFFTPEGLLTAWIDWKK
jgi:hypothetical protein